MERCVLIPLENSAPRRKLSVPPGFPEMMTSFSELTPLAPAQCSLPSFHTETGVFTKSSKQVSPSKTDETAWSFKGKEGKDAAPKGTDISKRNTCKEKDASKGNDLKENEATTGKVVSKETDVTKTRDSSSKGKDTSIYKPYRDRLDLAVREKDPETTIALLRNMIMEGRGNIETFNIFINRTYSWETRGKLRRENAIVCWMLDRWSLDGTEYYMGKPVSRKRKIPEKYRGTFLHRLVAFCDVEQGNMSQHLKLFTLLHDKQRPAKCHQACKSDPAHSTTFRFLQGSSTESVSEEGSLSLESLGEQVDISESLYTKDSFRFLPLQWAVLMNDVVSTYLILWAMTKNLDASAECGQEKKRFRMAVKKAFHTMMISPYNTHHHHHSRHTSVYDLLVLVLEPAGLSVGDFYLMDAMPGGNVHLIRRLLDDGIQLVRDDVPYPFHPLHYAIKYYDDAVGVLIINHVLKRCFLDDAMNVCSYDDEEGQESGEERVAKSTLHFLLARCRKAGKGKKGAGMPHVLKQMLLSLLSWGEDPELRCGGQTCYEQLPEGKMLKQFQSLREAAVAVQPC